LRGVNLAGVVAVAIIIFAVWVTMVREGQVPGHTGLTVNLGALSADAVDVADVLVTLQPPTDQLTTGRYDSFDSPVGTSYAVPAGKTLLIVGGDAPDESGSPALYSVGYGDTHVENSVSAPTNPVVITKFTVTEGARELALWAEIPSGKFPFVFFDGGSGGLDGNPTFWGVED
jgi:hypothetical protein